MYMMTCSLRTLAEKLPPAWDVELVETHHMKKKDSPSGTALQLSRILSELRIASGEAGPSDIPVHSLRIGDVPGRHSAMFAGPGEIIEVSHSVHSRKAFAAGALVAARFMQGKKPGWYVMDDLFSGQL
jgi:4-hydroxy-tetrahydrodipicolinate reductase